MSKFHDVSAHGGEQLDSTLITHFKAALVAAEMQMAILTSGLAVDQETDAGLGDENFVIVQFNYNENTTKMWVNPDMSAFDYANPSAPDAESDFAIAFDQFELVFRDNIAFDELAVIEVNGTKFEAPDFSDVADAQTGSTTGLDSVEDSLVLWLDATNINAQDNAGLSNGDAISTWMDLSGNGNDLSGGVAPNYDGATNMVNFDSGDHLTVFDRDSLRISGGDHSMIIVLHPDATDHDFISTWGVSSGHALMQFYNNKFAPPVFRGVIQIGYMLEITYLLNRQVYLHRLSVNQILALKVMLTGFILVIVSLKEQQAMHQMIFH